MFHVYVEGVTGAAPDAVRKLSDAIAERYGFPAAEIYARLSKGRLRVKSNANRMTADELARDLEAIGARVRIEDANSAASSAALSLRPTVVGAPAVRTSPAIVRRSSISTAPPMAALPVEPSVSARSTKDSVPPPPRASPLPVSPGASSSRPSPSPSSPPLLASSSSALPPQTASRPATSSLPPQPASRSNPSSLPPLPGKPLAPRAAAPSRQSEPAARAARSSLPPQPASRSATPSSGRPGGRPALTSLPLPASALPTDQIPTVLGALGGDGQLSLGSLDDNSPGTPASYAANDGLPASIGPAASYAPHEGVSASIGPAAASPAASAPRARPVAGTQAPVDRFAPPEAEAEELVVEIAPDELEHRARKRRSSPPVFAPEPPARRSAPILPSPSEPPLRGSTPLLQSPATMLPSPRLGPTPRLAPIPSEPRPAGGSSVAHRLLASPRARFGAGVMLAIVLGFIPAAIVGALRVRSAFHAIDARVIAAQAAVDSPQSYDALDELRAGQLEAKRSARRAIVLTSMLLWAAAGGGLAYVWFKRLPWQRFG